MSMKCQTLESLASMILLQVAATAVLDLPLWTSRVIFKDGVIFPEFTIRNFTVMDK